jgi:L-lactate dehydrogenase complex protein LldG
MTQSHSSSDARDEILARIRAALPGEAADPAVSYSQIQRTYRATEDLTREACLELFLDRLLDYDTEVLQIETETEIPSAILQALHQAGEDRVLVASEFPSGWLPNGFHFEPEDQLTTRQMEMAQAVLTTCEIAIASTGTIVLVHEGAQGRRALTLLPDHHLCLIRRDQVVATVPEALRATVAQMAKPVTTISGPSATSDIEMTRVRGVHGPRRLTVILYGETAKSTHG